MDNKKLNKISLSNLVIAYLMSFTFILLILLNIPPKEKDIEIVFQSLDFNKSETERAKQYTEFNNTFILNDRAPIYHDRLEDIVISNGDPSIVNLKGQYASSFVPLKPNLNRHNETRTLHNDVLESDLDADVGSSLHRRSDSIPLDKRRDIKTSKLKDYETLTYEEAIANHKSKNRRDIGINSKDSSKDGLNISNLSPVSKNDELSKDLALADFSKYSSGDGLKGGELYAYNYPSRGVGAGIGSGSLGATAGQAAGISAGIGEGLFNGKSVPALGGVGDGAKNIYGEPMQSAGVGGLIGGAGAGGAAGLSQGYITKELGLGIQSGLGAGGRGHQRVNYDHLPKNGALHIMMHVDGSGSILNTRKQLDIMKDTLLKEALLPYYNNDESLYNNRVSIIDDSGERTLRFFSKASERENVLAIAFQDEAQPSYHLPNFNKKPEDHYLDDLKVLHGKLNDHKGIYRGILFQVDRGKTFAKSFKEFVGNAFQGKGYLKNKNLKQYYWEDNQENIRRKKGIVFSDEYHTQDNGDPQYYLNILFEASKKVGLDLDIYGNGLKDGINYKK